MANNAQFPGPPGMQPLRPPMPLGPPQGAPPSMSMQFRPAVPVPVVPAQQSQPYNAVPPQQFHQVGRTNVGLPSHNQPFQFSQPVQQLPPRPSLVGSVLQPPQPIPIQEAQANRPSISASQQPLQNAQIPNNYAVGFGGPRMSLSSSYTFGAPSSGQRQRNADASVQYQLSSQTNVSSFPVGGQPWLPTGSQSMTSAVPVQQIDEHYSATTTAAVLEPVPVEKFPSDWLEHTSRNGKKYYYNKKTKFSTWEKPPELMTPTERADASTDWKEYKSPEGRKYYYNKVTKQSKWTIPDELKLAREQMKMAYTKETKSGNGNSPAPDAVAQSVVKATPSNAVTSSSSVQGVVPSPVEAANISAVVNPHTLATPGPADLPVVTSMVTTTANEVRTPVEIVTPITAVLGSDETSETLVTTTLAQMSNTDNKAAQDVGNSVDGVSTGVTEEADKGKGSAGNVDITAPGEKTVVQEPLVYENKLEARNAFKALLESANIGSDWTWDQAMRVIINDQRYGALRTLGERKQAFNEVLVQKKKQDADERRARQKKAQEDFRTMLEECKELTSSTRWSKAVAIFEDDERFKAVERAKDREDLFEYYMVELEKKERATALEEYKRDRMEYLNFLKSCDFITASSQWRKVQDRLEADERCSCLEKIDRLEIFQEYVRDLEREEEEQMKLRMEELRKTERKNRDEFRKLMEGHVDVGILTAETHWRDYCMKVKDLPAYLAVSSNTSGSTAKDLFDDVAEELQKQYLEDKAQIKDALKLRKVALSSNWTLEDFRSVILEDISSPPLSGINLKLVFDELQKRAKEKEEKEAKRRKRLGDDFYDLLGSSKDIAVSSKWEDSKQLLADRQDRFIGEESFFKEIFEKYITELKEKVKEKEKERKRRDDKAKRERDAKDREKKVKQLREKGRGFDSKHGKDGTQIESAEKTESYGFEENKRSGKDKDKKHRKRHQSSVDDLSVDENEKDRSKNYHRHTSDRKKSKQMEQHSTSEPDSESRHRRQKKDHRNSSHRNGDNDEMKDRQFCEDGEFG